jgi:uncharacterized RDD family membrane protein YckC
MAQIPPGWYPDPAPAAPGAPPMVRWWNGYVWTEHVAPGVMPAPAYTSTLDLDGVTHVTPDGVTLAGWWSRVAARILDELLVGVVILGLAYPWLHPIINRYIDFFRAADDGVNPSVNQLMRDVLPDFVVVVLIGLAISVVYEVGFLAWRRATPGKMALGLQVRLRERDALPFRANVLRMLFKIGYAVFNAVPLLNLFTGIYALLNELWPLWDGKRQALHDKVAKTNVVKVG